MSVGRHFDERITSGLMIQEKLASLENKSILSSSNSSSSLTKSSIQWNKLSKISEYFHNNEAHDYGNPEYLKLSETYISIGTSKGYILLFNYTQKLVLELKPFDFSSKIPAKAEPLDDETVEITAIEISLDSTYLIAGYSNGFINIWDLQNSDPLITVRPVTLHELQYNGNHYHVSHQYGVAVRKIQIIGFKHTTFMSLDDSGMLFIHHGHRSFLANYVQSRIISGEYTLTTQKSNDNLIPKFTSVQDFQLLPIGSKKIVADKLSLVAYITPAKTTIASTRPQLSTFLTMNNLNLPKSLDNLTSLLAWYPAVKKTESSSELPLLAYCWSNELFLVKVISEFIIDESGEESPDIQVIDKKELKLDENIQYLSFLNCDILIVMTASKKLILIDSNKLNILHSETLNINTSKSGYRALVNTMKSSMVVVERKGLLTGSLLNWADILLSLLSNGKYVEALEESKRQYIGDYDMPLISLSSSDKERHKLMDVYLIRIFKTTIKYIFNDSEIEIYGIRKITTLVIETCLMINAPVEMYDLVYEKLLEINEEDAFFQVLETFIFTSKITSFSPSILKSMVEYYNKVENIDTLKRLICSLDIEQLDVDLTLSLCRKYQLYETSTYIWTVLMHDYITPFMDAISAIKRLENDSLSEVDDIKKNIDYVYPFISYTLTSRQYPTEKSLIDDPSAKYNLYYLLFHGSAVEWPIGYETLHITDDFLLEPSFPYFFALLKYDSQSMLSCLNEAFEDDLLNDLETSIFEESEYKLKVNRQYIIDILLNVFHEQESRFSLIDKIRMAIFVARNYPKYIQFIRIADSIAEEMIELLCLAGTMKKDNLEDEVTDEVLQDCQLAIRSILTVYKPIDIDSIMIQIERAEYYQVLLSLYQSEERLFDVLKLWVKLQHEEYEQCDLFKPIYEILIDSIRNLDSLDVREVIELLRDNFEIFVRSNPKRIAEVVASFCPELNSEVIEFKDSNLKFEYLKEFFDVEETVGKFENKSVDDTLKIEYLKGLIKKRNIIQNLLANGVTKSEIGYIEELEFRLDELKTKIQSFVFTLSELDSATIDVLEIDNFEIIVDWYLNHSDFQSAIDEICKVLENKTETIEKEGYSSVLENKLWKVLDKGFSSLSSTSYKLCENHGDFTLKESLLLQMLETCVKLFNKTTSEGTKQDTEISILYTKIIRSAFTNVINLNSEEVSTSFSKIFKKFLDGSSVHVTTLGDVRSILKEIFNSYTTDEKILKLVKRLVDGDIFASLDILEELKKRGRSPKNIECATCGKNIWGSKVGNEVYEAWKGHQFSNGSEEEFNFKSSVFIFKCKHAFHRKCLDNMGMVHDSDKKCVICENI